jgi:two-component system response regulator AtoC
MDSRLPRTVSVLVGDDDVAVRESVAAILDRRQLRVVTAVSGDHALRVLLSEPIDLSILDVEMPGMTGIEVLRRYLTGPWIAGPQGAPARRGDARSMPTIFMSGNRDARIRNACEALGESFLDKPFGADAMRDAVERILRNLTL